MLGIAPVEVMVSGGAVHIVPDPEQLANAINSFWLAMLPIGLFVVIAAWLFGRTIAAQALRPLVETTASLSSLRRRRLHAASRRDDGSQRDRRARRSVQSGGRAGKRRLRRAAGGGNADAPIRRRCRPRVAHAAHRHHGLHRRVAAARARTTTGISTKIYDTMLVESRRMKALIDKLILLARLENQPRRAPRSVDLGEVASDVVGALASARGAAAHRPRTRRLAHSCAPTHNELHDALSNLVENALKYAPDSPVDVRVGVERRRGRLRGRRSRAGHRFGRTAVDLRPVLSRARRGPKPRVSVSGSRSPNARSNARAVRSAVASAHRRGQPLLRSAFRSRRAERARRSPYRAV